MIIKAIEYIISFFHTIIIKISPNIAIGKDSLIYFKTPLVHTSGGKITIGNHTRIGCSKRLYHAGMPYYTKLYVEGANSKITIGDHCRIFGAFCHAKKSIKIGNNCLLASGVNVLDSNAHETYSANRTIGRDKPQEIVIGDNVWIGVNSIILKGTTIGDNCVVGAGSVVKGVFPDNCIIQGNPAVIVKQFELKED